MAEPRSVTCKLADRPAGGGQHGAWSYSGFARGQGGSLLFRAFGEGQWNGWVNLGNQLSTDPVAVKWPGAGRTVHVAAIDSNNDFAHVGLDQTPPTIAASGGLYTARNEASLTSGALNVHADDDYSGVDSITLYERNSAGARTRLGGDGRACPAKGCETTAYDWSYTLNPAALGWQTGVHRLTLEAADRAGASVSPSTGMSPTTRRAGRTAGRTTGQHRWRDRRAGLCGRLGERGDAGIFVGGADPG